MSEGCHDLDSGVAGIRAMEEGSIGIKIDDPIKEILKDTNFEMTVGDVDSQDMGTAARANGAKPDWSLMPLGQIAYLMKNMEELSHLRWKIGDAEMTEILGRFQAGDCDIETVLEYSVVYNWAMVCLHVKKDATFMESLEPVIAVWDYGRAKYAVFNWAKGAPWSVPVACMQRHINWYWDKGEVADQESKQLHSAHVVCNAMMLAHYAVYWKEGDDRPLFAFKKPKDPSSIILHALAQKG